MIPVIYIHFGSIPPYLERSLKQALLFNKRLILITDCKYELAGVDVVSASAYETDKAQFESAYIHMSSNTPEFEKVCIWRWFVLRNFMNQKKIDLCYYSDSDVMIYEDLTNLRNSYPDFDVAYAGRKDQSNYHWAATACCSYWTSNAITSFCEFVLELYRTSNGPLQEKWSYHKTNNIPGGICDMTLLYLFTDKVKFQTLSEVNGEVVFDQNMTISENYFKDEYEMDYSNQLGISHKKISWVRNQPWGYNKILNKRVRFAVLTEYAKLLQNQKSVGERMKQGLKKNIKRLIGR